MSELLIVGAAAMDSTELRGLINAERKAYGEPEVRLNQFVERCKDELEGDHYKSFVVANPNGTTSEALSLTIDQCMLIAMRESKGVRRSVQAKLKARQGTPQRELSRIELLQIALQAEQERLALAETLKLQAPKVEFADALLHADGTTLVRDVAKALGVGVRALEKALRQKGVILANNAPAATYVAKGYFKEATHPFETKTRGTQISHTARVTGKGIEFIRRFVRRHSVFFGGKTGAA